MANEPDTWLGPNHHPYHPQSLQLPTYVPNSSPIPIILGSFSGLIALFISAGLVLARRYNASIKHKTGEQFTIVWFLLCSFLFCCFSQILSTASLPFFSTNN